MCNARPQSMNGSSTAARASMRPCGPRSSPAHEPEQGSADPWLASAGAAASIDSAAVSPRLANLWRSCSMPLPPDSTIAVACCLHLLPLRAFTLRRDEALEVEAADHALELVDAFGLSFGLHLEAFARSEEHPSE